MEKRLAVIYRNRILLPVLKCGWSSGSDYSFIHQGNTVTRLEGGFFGKFIHYTAIGVEVEQACNGLRPLPILVVKDIENRLYRFNYDEQLRIASYDTAPASSVQDGWICSHYLQPAQFDNLTLGDRFTLGNSTTIFHKTADAEYVDHESGALYVGREGLVNWVLT